MTISDAELVREAMNAAAMVEIYEDEHIANLLLKLADRLAQRGERPSIEERAIKALEGHFVRIWIGEPNGSRACDFRLSPNGSSYAEVIINKVAVIAAAPSHEPGAVPVLVTPPAPRYDEVYEQGMEWLNKSEANCLCIHAIEQTPGQPVIHDPRCSAVPAGAEKEET